MVSDDTGDLYSAGCLAFQSALRFAVASDLPFMFLDGVEECLFQSALRFAVASDLAGGILGFGALRFNPLCGSRWLQTIASILARP